MAHKRDEIADRLRQRIVAGLHLGVVREGDRLPSVRVMAAEVDADPRVVLAAYRQLEAEGHVEVRERSGVFVAPRTPRSEESLPRLADWVVEVLVQALGNGVPAVDVPERMRRCLRTLRLRTACVECNQDQIAGLCGELSRDYGLETTGVEVEAIAGGRVPEEVREVDLFVTTPFHAAEVQAVAEGLGKPLIIVHLRPDFRAEIERFLQQGPVYFVASDPRFAGKLRMMLSGTAREDNLRVLIAGRDDLAIPDLAPTYVMPSARAQLQGLPLLSRVIPAPRVFASESAREILSFIVRSNLAAERGRDGHARE